jgi:hypothetical protein
MEGTPRQRGIHWAVLGAMKSPRRKRRALQRSEAARGRRRWLDAIDLAVGTRCTDAVEAGELIGRQGRHPAAENAKSRRLKSVPHPPRREANGPTG